MSDKNSLTIDISAPLPSERHEVVDMDGRRWSYRTYWMPMSYGNVDGKYTNFYADIAVACCTNPKCKHPVAKHDEKLLVCCEDDCPCMMLLEEKTP